MGNSTTIKPHAKAVTAVRLLQEKMRWWRQKHTNTNATWSRKRRAQRAEEKRRLQPMQKKRSWKRNARVQRTQRRSAKSSAQTARLYMLRERIRQRKLNPSVFELHALHSAYFQVLVASTNVITSLRQRQVVQQLSSAKQTRH